MLILPILSLILLSFKAFFKSTGDWMKNTFLMQKEAGKAAMEMTKAFDAEFELENSLRIKRAQIQGELADLQVELMNTKSFSGSKACCC